MAAASPTPLVGGYDGFPRRPISRPYNRSQPTRPYLKRGSPLSIVSAASNISSVAPRHNSIGDSSDDEGSVPLLSAEAEEILGVGPIKSENPVTNKELAFSAIETGTTTGSPPKKDIIQSFGSVLRERTSSPLAARSRSPRIVRLSVGSVGSVTLRRTVSTSSVRDSEAMAHGNELDLNTPALRPKNPNSRKGSLESGSEENGIEPSNDRDPLGRSNLSASKYSFPPDQLDLVHETAMQLGSLTVNRTKTEETGTHGSLRIKRVGKVAGRYLSGPARRGMIRRQSEEDQSPVQEEDAPSANRQAYNMEKPTIEEQKKETDTPVVHWVQTTERDRPNDPQSQPQPVRFTSQPQVTSSSASAQSNSSKQDVVHMKPTASSGLTASQSASTSGKHLQPVFKVPPLPNLPSRYDQENEPPPTFKRNKPNGLDLLDKAHKIPVMMDDKLSSKPHLITSPSRKPLSARSHNTPMRAAPPPPKMTVLETVTATAGAASASQKKKRNYISVNGKLFTRMDCVGRGGSAKVYRVMAENYKVFALKRVSLEDVDELAIRGYKGEIELLRKLENVDRVVRLFDWEINDERQTLSILMEMGESDLNKVLTVRLNADNAKFDISFARYYWKEMLECVQAVHQYDIVHSDLKPANFLLVQGRLKLIDFGIANAIQDDTVNVHREQTIGTPNYMAPESLIDFNAASGLPSSVGKMMKLGKPSDIWSLGCILNQMVYGKPPFAHIAQQHQRIMAIPNPNHVIEFADRGVGGVPVPTGLIRTLRKCLTRDLSQRPTVEQLLADGDPFLHPDTQIQGTVPVGEELIARLQHNIVKHIRERGMPTEVELSTWPARFFASIKAAVEEGRA